MDTLTIPSTDCAYPVTKELAGDRLFGACAAIYDRLEKMQHEEDQPGFELFFTGTSGTAIVTGIAAYTRAKTDPMDLAYCQVAKNTDTGAHHRATVETTHKIKEKRGYPRIFVDDFTASGETFRRTVNHVDLAAGDSMHEIRSNFDGFDGVIVLSGEVRDDIRNRVNFVIKPEDY